MSERICALCGKGATGYASEWSAATGERWFCHGDDDETPTCYERRNWFRNPLTMFVAVLASTLEEDA